MVACQHSVYKMTALKSYHASDFEQMPKLFRTQFFNSLTGFKSINLVGTVDKKGQLNLAIFGQVFHLGADPSLMGMIVRPASVPRNTLENIEETKVFTLNHIKADFAAQAHQTSARYDKAISEFNEVGLTPYHTDKLIAPYVKESDIRIGLKCIEKIPIKSNETILVVGEILEVMLPEAIVSDDGFIDIHEAGTIAGGGLDAYFSTNKLQRLSYAKPNKDLTQIPF